MHKAVPAFTVQHYIALLININYWSVSKTAETNASRPRPQNFGLERSRDEDRGVSRTTRHMVTGCAVAQSLTPDVKLTDRPHGACCYVSSDRLTRSAAGRSDSTWTQVHRPSGCPSQCAGKWSIYFTYSARVSDVTVSASLSPNYTSDLRQFLTHVTYGRGSVSLWRRCDMLGTSGFVGDVIFAHPLYGGMPPYTGWVKKVSCCTVIDISKARQ